MASATISNSAGPGSSIQLSDVTIAVRDKVIEKFADEPLEKMNDSVKMLLNNEEDEQRRLGILAARVYILRQRIVNLSEEDKKRVISSTAVKPELTTDAEADTVTAENNNSDDNNGSEWTRLRILEDCEVNGVRFPKTVIIDVKTEDAAKLVESGNAELVEEQPTEAVQDTDASEGDVAIVPETESSAGDDTDGSASQAASADDNPSTQSEADISTDIQELAGDSSGPIDSLSDPAPALTEPTESDAEINLPDVTALQAEPEAENGEAETNESGDGSDDTGETLKEAFIEAPSAAEVTAALEALSAGDTMDITAAPPSEDAESATAIGSDEGPSKNEIDGEKTSGWFEAQQNAEAMSKSEADTTLDLGTSDESDKQTDSDK